MADLTIKFKGQPIVEMTESGTKTLKTAGKYCEGDIKVEYAKPAGGGATEPYIEEVYDSSGNLIDATLHGYTIIRSYAFYYCSSLALTSLPSGITSIGDYAFQSCSSLALTSLPSGITSIGSSAFNSCSSLALTSFPSGITSIGSNAFGNCRSLASLTFEGTPTSISSSAFYRCTNITTINVPWSEGAVANAPWGATNATINYNYTGA